MRFPDIRWTLDRLTVELTASTSICRRAIWGLAGDRGSDDGGEIRYRYAISYESDTNPVKTPP